jgi:antitoxin (DNA-binding transcriptional repressor) of toxin-antitoxin stability system
MSVTISELKRRLSHYLRLVRTGETLVARDRDVVIARIEPAGGEAADTGDDERRLAELERRGVVRRAVGTLSDDWLARRPSVDADVEGALHRDREDGR